MILIVIVIVIERNGVVERWSEGELEFCVFCAFCGYLIGA